MSILVDVQRFLQMLIIFLCLRRLVIVSMCITAMISDLPLCIRHGRDEDSLPLGKVSCFN